jgi:hypothetical protein
VLWHAGRHKEASPKAMTGIRETFIACGAHKLLGHQSSTRAKLPGTVRVQTLSDSPVRGPPTPRNPFRETIVAKRCRGKSRASRSNGVLGPTETQNGVRGFAQGQQSPQIVEFCSSVASQRGGDAPTTTTGGTPSELARGGVAGLSGTTLIR